MPAAWIGAAAGVYGAYESSKNSGGSTGSTGGSGNKMYVPTGLGGADTGWQQNQQTNQNQLNYGGQYPSFMGGASGWNADGTLGGEQGSYPTGHYGGGQQGSVQPGQAGYTPSGSYGGSGGTTTGNGTIGGFGQQGFNGFQNSGSGGMLSQGSDGVYSPSGGGNGMMHAMDQSYGPGAGAVMQNYGQTAQQASSSPYGNSGGGQSAGLAGMTDPAYQQSYQLAQGINYNPYLQASQQAGQQYGQLANQAAGAGNISYGQAAQGFGQQQNLQNTGNQYYGQQEQLGRQQQQLGYSQLGQSQGLASGLQQAGQQAYQSGFDPQNALYNQQFQQATDQANAVNSMYGLGSSGAGAGMTTQAQQNFNTGWENQQLGRQVQGLSAMTGANQAASGILGTGYGAAQQGVSGAGQLNQYGATGLSQLNQTGIQSGDQGSANLQAGLGYYGQQPGYTQQSAQTPLGAQQMVAGMPSQNASQYVTGISGSMTPYDQQQNQAIPYMNYGSGAGSNAFQNTLAANKQSAAQQGAAAQGLGNALGGINWSQVGNWFSGNNGNPGGVTNDQSGGYGDNSDYSDIRLKTNIVRIGTTARGNALYRWDWKTGGSGQGVIAQEVQHIPGAVHADEDGILMVDYSKV